jgi:hypothetical protein
MLNAEKDPKATLRKEEYTATSLHGMLHILDPDVGMDGLVNNAEVCHNVEI